MPVAETGYWHFREHQRREALKTTVSARLLPLLALVALSTFGQQASAQASDDGWTISELAASAPFTEGTHFERLDTPQDTQASDGEVEVRLFFIYGCSHCAMVEPSMNRWVAEAPENVHFVRMPVASWNQTAGIHAKIFWTLGNLRATGTMTDTEREAIHAAVFETIHDQGIRLLREDEIRAFFAREGVDPSEFETAWNSSWSEPDRSLSFAEQLAAQRAAQHAVERMLSVTRDQPLEYGVERTPTIVINGKYRTDLAMAGQDFFNVINYLVALETAR